MCIEKHTYVGVCEVTLQASLSSIRQFVDVIVSHAIKYFVNCFIGIYTYASYRFQACYCMWDGKCPVSKQQQFLVQFIIIYIGDLLTIPLFYVEGLVLYCYKRECICAVSTHARCPSQVSAIYFMIHTDKCMATGPGLLCVIIAVPPPYPASQPPYVLSSPLTPFLNVVPLLFVWPFISPS